MASSASNGDNRSGSGSIRCHYDVLGVDQSADVATIKKAHRKLALKYHPDKNSGNGDTENAAEQFRLVQQAYECLSDPMERKWYDDHRDAILRGWSANGGGDGSGADMLFDVVPFTYAGVFKGYSDDEGGFYAVYRSVFQKIYEGEEQGTRSHDGSSSLEYLSTDFGTSESEWSDVATFYQGWESFASGLNFAWADTYDIKEAPNRRVRRLMEDENRKARKAAKRARNDDVLALVRFVKKRDPRVQRKLEQLEAEKQQKEKDRKEEVLERKRQAQQAREDWKVEAEKNLAQREEEDRLAGRLRLADLGDDYDYGGGKKKKGKRKKGKNSRVVEDENEEEQEKEGDDPALTEPTEMAAELDGTDLTKENDESSSDIDAGIDASTEQQQQSADLPETNSEVDESDGTESDEEEGEPDVWRCLCCRKEFKSEAQMANHMKSKKHKEAFKKYQAKMQKEKDAVLDEFLVS